MQSNGSIKNVAVQRYRWDVAELAPGDHLRGFDGVPPLIVQLLWNRRIREPAAIESYLAGGDVAASSPFTMRGMPEAIQRIVQSRAAEETVAIYGDYDVDGMTGTAILTSCLRLLGIKTLPFLPRRDVEGYGLHVDAIARLRDAGAGLLIAIDCGISGNSAVDFARGLDLDVIVADHHHVPDVLPNAVAVINPNQPDCPYPFKGLCAAGIAYKLTKALLEAVGLSVGLAEQWLDLTTLGTIADVVPLLGENRRLVSRGLQAIGASKRPGIQALLAKAGVTQNEVSAQAIAFRVAPRLNAVGRLSDPNLGLQLLLTDSLAEAESLATELDEANRERQRQTELALGSARRRVAAQPSLPKLLFVADESYPLGVVGLVAGRLSEELSRPVLVAGITDGVVRGSARSIARFHIAEALAACDDLLLRHGGHARAAGFTVASGNVERLRGRLEHLAERQLTDHDVEPSLAIDAELALRRWGPDLYRVLGRLEPFGFENAQPVLLSRRLRVREARVVGRTTPRHLRLSLTDGHTAWEAIGFGMGDRSDSLADFLDVVYRVERHEWNGQSGVQLRVIDLRPSIG